MTELAYMVRENWGQDGTAMVPQSTIIRDWLGESPYLFAVVDTKEFTPDERGVDFEAAKFIAPDPTTRKAFNIAELATLIRNNEVINHPVMVLHPRDQRSLETIREAVESKSVSRLCVLVWSPHDIVRTWLDARGALNLHTGKAMTGPHPLMIEASKMMIGHQYNGLSSGQGKDAVIQLLRAFTAEGYPLDADAWLRAYFAAGGEFHHADSIEKFVKEMKAGTKHRVKQSYVDNIFEIIEQRVVSGA